jgi:antitoxin VapB
MALYLKDKEVDALARELAELERRNITEAVRLALKERRDRLLEAREEKQKRVREKLEKIWALPLVDERPADEILYDEHGLPK